MQRLTTEQKQTDISLNDTLLLSVILSDLGGMGLSIDQLEKEGIDFDKFQEVALVAMTKHFGLPDKETVKKFTEEEQQKFEEEMIEKMDKFILNFILDKYNQLLTVTP